MTNRPDGKAGEPLGTLVGATVLGLLIGSFVLWGCVSTWIHIVQAEASGGQIRSHRFVVAVYKMGGKWLALGPIALVGAAFLAMGVGALVRLIRRLLNGRR